MASVLYEQSHHTHRYLNFVVDNTLDVVAQAQNEVKRGSNIILNPEDYLLSIDRYSIKSCIIPVWDSTVNPLVFTLKDKSNGNSYSGTVTTSQQFFFTLHEVKELMNTAMSDAMTAYNTGESVSLNAPTFDFSNNLWSLNTDSAFRADVDIYFNMSAYLHMNTFEFETLNPLIAGNEIGKLLLDDDIIEQRNQTMEKWIPLQNIIVKSTLPIIDEFTGERDTNFSTASEPILTDFQVFPVDSSALLSVEYSASGNHRWISMSEASELKQFRISFFWEDRFGKQYPLLLPPQDLVSMKLLFKEDAVTMKAPKEKK